MNELITVIIPSWNRPELTVRAIHSVLAQRYPHFELIVVNDGSTEDYSEVERLLKASEQRYITTTNRGVSSARNAGIAGAKGKWICFLDSDDLWLPEKLEAQMSYIREHPECRVIQTYEKWIRKGKEVNIPERLLPVSGEAFLKSLHLCCISPSAVMIKKEVFDKTGVFDERFIVCEDYDLWLRLTSFFPVHLIKECLVVKYSEPHPQLSRSQVAMDRFRVYALLKYLSYQDVPSENKSFVSDILIKKLDILHAGASKRGKSGDAERYKGLREALDALFCSDMNEDCYTIMETLLNESTYLLDKRFVSEE